MRTPFAPALALTLALALVAGCSTPAPDPYARAPDGSHEDTIAIPQEEVAYPPFGARVPVHVVAHLQVVNGSAIDAWLTNRTTCQIYGTHAFHPTASALNVTNATLTADFPEGDGCLLLDNTDFALGKVNSTGNVTVHYRIDIWERKG